MSIRLDLTAVVPELLDAVICMNESPAYAAFREEIEDIIKGFNESGHLSLSTPVVPEDLTVRSADTLVNMQKAFLIWASADERKNGCDEATSCHTIGKMFYKSQKDLLISLNKGEDSVESCDVRPLIKAFMAELGANSEAFDSVKEFFRGYVYGYSFNYLKEATVMKQYAEMLVFLGIMSGKVTATVSEQQKTLPKMAMLLPHDRFKYLSGFVPTELTMDIVFDRIEMSDLPANEQEIVRKRIKDYILANYKTEREDDVDLIADDVTASFASTYFSEYTDAVKFADGIYQKSSSGKRMFLDGDRDDSGDFTSAKIAQIISDKCNSGCNSFYDAARAPLNDTAIGGNELCYRYPVVYKGSEGAFFSPVYEEFIYPVLEDAMYVAAEIPAGVYPFADEKFGSNPIRAIGRLEGTAKTVRRDRLDVLEKLKSLTANKTLSDRDREMQILEVLLCLVSGNMNSEDYRKMVIDNVFTSEIYGIYMRYRSELIAGGHLNDFDSRKALLDVFNKLAQQ